jgi:hypothetical protein
MSDKESMKGRPIGLFWETTGERRPPKEGEFFLGYKGEIDQALFDFTEQSFEIVRRKEAADE